MNEAPSYSTSITRYLHFYSRVCFCTQRGHMIPQRKHYLIYYLMSQFTDLSNRYKKPLE